MTKKILLSLAAIFVMASCSTKIDLVKRKYGKGYYVSVVKKHNNVKSHEANTAVAKQHPAKVADQSSEVMTVQVKQNVLAEPVIVANQIKTESSKQISANSAKNQGAVTAQATKHSPVADKHGVKPLPALKKLKNLVNSGAAKGNSDTNLIILVILCFLWFFNLIAVYLKDGSKITLNFWITLLLDFTFIGGVIFSLLVVLDIVNLA